MFTTNVGNTEIVRIKSLLGEKKYVYVKLELNNPTGSIKDRLADYVVSNYYKNSLSYIDTSIGNFAMSLSLFARMKGKQASFVLNESIDHSVIERIKLFGGEVMLSDARTHLELSNLARSISEQRGLSFVGQFMAGKYDSFYAHYFSNEINNQLDKVDKVVCYYGTGSILRGLRKGLFMGKKLGLYEAIDSSKTADHDNGFDKIPVDIDFISTVQKYLIQNYCILSGRIGSLNTAAAMIVASESSQQENILTFISDSL